MTMSPVGGRSWRVAGGSEPKVSLHNSVYVNGRAASLSEGRELMRLLVMRTRLEPRRPCYWRCLGRARRRRTFRSLRRTSRTTATTPGRMTATLSTTFRSTVVVVTGSGPVIATVVTRCASYFAALSVETPFSFAERRIHPAGRFALKDKKPPLKEVATPGGYLGQESPPPVSSPTTGLASHASKDPGDR